MDSSKSLEKNTSALTTPCVDKQHQVMLTPPTTPRIATRIDTDKRNETPTASTSTTTPIPIAASTSTTTTTLPNPGLSNKKIGKRQYLVTYSNADATKFPTRKSFAEYIVAKFNEGAGEVKVEKWVACKEPHKTKGFHYHVALKMDGVKKWYGPWRKMYNDGVAVSFSDAHNYYISAYKYVTKEDEFCVKSDGHEDLDDVGSPRTKQCMVANRRKSADKKAAGQSSSKKGKDDDGDQVASSSAAVEKPRSLWNKKLSNIDIADYVIRNNISSKTELYAAANKRKIDGECDMAIFLFSRSEKYILELIHKAWLLHGAEKIISEDAKTRMVRMEDALAEECAETDCKWLEMALQVLELNKIKREDFKLAMFNAIRFGRQKFRNVMLVGRSNCAKTFLLKPLKVIFGKKVFENPAKDKYGWQGVENAQVILLNDFRYSKEMISWSDLLLLLEGETVKLPTPKNHCANDIHLDSSNDIPIFATSLGKIEYSRYSPDYEVETEMMDSRWNLFKFTHIFKKDDQKDITPCKHCFAELVMN